MRIDHGDPIWLELATDDMEEAAAFYGAVFGWRMAYDEELGGVVAGVGGRPVASINGALGENGERLFPAAWNVWLKVDDVAAATTAAVGARGNIVSPPREYAGLGHHAVVEDPSGAQVILWQPERVRKWALGSGHGQPCWFDVVSASFDAARTFYHAVGGWRYYYTLSDGTLDTSEPLQGEYRHAVNGGQGGATAGILDPREVADSEGGSRWLLYLAASDVDETCRAVEEAGGSVVEPPRDLPLGRVAGLKDPHGAEFRILDSPYA